MHLIWNFNSSVTCQTCVVISLDQYRAQILHTPTQLRHSRVKYKFISLQALSSALPLSMLKLHFFEYNENMINIFAENGTYFMKSSRDIQKTPSSDPRAMSSYLNSGVHRGDASDQSPVHEKRPHGLRRRTSLWHNKVTDSVIMLNLWSV